MKKLFTFFLVLTICLNIAACQKTPYEALVAQKNPERLESAAKETANEENSLKEQKKAVAENYIFHYENGDKSLGINADVPVTMPESDTIPALRASSGTISQELVTRIYDYLFPDGKTYIFSGTDRTKSAIEKKILEQKQWIAELEASENHSEEMKQDSIADIQSIIADLEEEYKTAPEKSTLVKTPVDSMLVKNTSPETNNCDYELHCETEEGETLDIWSYPVNEASSSDIC